MNIRYKKLLKGLVYTAIILILIFNTAFAYALDIKPPQPTAEFYCNDFADILSSSTEKSIVQLGEQIFTQTSGGQIVFVSIQSLEGSSIEEYANELFNNWKIGTEDKGILLLLSMDEGESRIEVGYGYEGTLTDLESYKLLEKLASINKAEGLEKAVYTVYSDICQIVLGEEPDYNYNDYNYDYNNDYSSDNNYSGSDQQKFIQFILKNPIVFVIVIVLILLDLVLTRGRITWFIFRMLASGSRRGGGGGGGRNSGGGGRSGGGGSSSRF